MLWIPQKGRVQVQHNTGVVATSAPGTAVTTGAAAATKGAAAQIFASTLFDAYWIDIFAAHYSTNGGGSRGCLDIMIGAATEHIIIPDLLMGYCGSYNDANLARSDPKRWSFPLYIPAGSRISARAAGERVNTAVNVLIYLYGGYGYPPFRVGTQVATLGLGTVPSGTPITPGASGAEGSWTQMIAATAADYFAFLPSFQGGGTNNMSYRALQIDIGIGAATEAEIGSWWFGTTDTESVGGAMPASPAIQQVPAGTRIVMRASNNSTNDPNYEAVVHAVR